MRAFFVTASGTGIGKTFLTAGLTRHLIAGGIAARAIKPVLSGFDPAEAEQSDTGILLAAQGKSASPVNIAAITPWRFAAALAPDMAARAEGASVPFGEITAFCRRTAEETNGPLFIEGVGGVMAPLTDEHTMLDLMAALDVPLILVVGSYLGAISHALTAAQAARGRDLALAAVVVSESEGSTVPFDETVQSISGRIGDAPCIGLPRAPGAHESVFSELAAVLGLGAA